MNLRTATILAFGAAITGTIVSMYRMVSLAIRLSNLGVLGMHTGVFFLSGNYWIYIGLVLLLAAILFRPGKQRAAALIMVFTAVIQLGFAIYEVVPIVRNPGYAEMLGGQSYISYQGLIWAVTILLFAVSYAIKPLGRGVRTASLFASLTAMTGVFFLVMVYSPLGAWIDIIIGTLLSLWFWLLLLNRDPEKEIFS